MNASRRPPRRRLLPALLFLLLSAGAAAWSLWPRRTSVDGREGAAAPDPGQDEAARAGAGVDLLSWFGSYDGQSPVPAVFVYAASRPHAAGGPGEVGASHASAIEPTAAGAAAGSRPAPERGQAAATAPSGDSPGPRPPPREVASPTGPDVPRPAAASQPVVRPQHKVSLVLVTANTARAVVDGKVVGVGDALRAGRVVGIVANGVQVDSGAERLFFKLGDPASDGTGKPPAAPPGGDK